MKHLGKKMALFLLITTALLPFPLSAQLLMEDTAEARFDRNYIISDEEMQDYQSMTREDIQAFLNAYDGYIARWRTTDKNNETRLTADIIHRASLEHRINPKYLLVKLQKEMSLITVKNPTERQLDFATGYGCPDSGGCDEKNRGFGKQVDSAAGIIRWYYNNYQKELWIKRPNRTYIIDGQIVIPKNLATAFLYTYTPHLHGNENFWKLWRAWFDQAYPDGTLVSAHDSLNVYLIQNGQKRLIKSMSVLLSRFEQKMILEAPAGELNNYEDGPGLSFPNYSILKQDSRYYLVDFDAIRPFADYNTVKALGYNPGEFIEVFPDDIAGYALGKIITADTANFSGRLVRLKENNSLYYLKDNFYYFISDPQMAKTNFPNLIEEKGAVVDLKGLVDGSLLRFKDGVLLGVNGSNKIYVIENGKKRHIANEEVFNGYGFDWSNIVWTDQLTGISHPAGQALYLPARLANF